MAREGTGHFALEDRLPGIAPLVGDFIEHTWKQVRGRAATTGM